jgi:diguanylate cyclase (GGDEF)-like protein
MDTHTLALVDISFLMLYATITLVYRTIHGEVQPGVRGVDWFIVSILNLVFLRTLYMTPGFAKQNQGMLAILLLVAHLLLHRAFAELLERGKMLWKLQVGLVPLGVVVWSTTWLIGGRAYDGKLISLVYSLQYGLTAGMLFWKSNRRDHLGAWFAGSMIGLFSICQVLWFSKVLWSSDMRSESPGRVPPAVWLVAHGAIAFAFLMLASSRLSQRLAREAGMDELTGLVNRRAIRRAALTALAQCRRREGQLAVLMFDLDGFKYVNDHLGHDAGDVFLRAVAKVVQGIVREMDTVARMGGDEFCVLLPDTDAWQAMHVAERCRLAITELVIPALRAEQQVSASFGVAHTTNWETSWEDLLLRSDAAMYTAKREGRNGVVMAPEVLDPEHFVTLRGTLQGAA